MHRFQFSEDVTDENISLDAQGDSFVVIREPATAALEQFVIFQLHLFVDFFELEIESDRVLILPFDFDRIPPGDLYRGEIRGIRSPHNDRFRVAIRKRLAPDPKQRRGHIEYWTELENIRL